MPKRIQEDHAEFKDVYAGRIRKEAQKFIKNGSIFRTRGNGKRIRMTVPRIDIPHLVHGRGKTGIGRGPGKPGDVIDKIPKRGKGKGNKAGEDHQDGVYIDLDVQDILKVLQEELELPDLKPKESNTFDEIRIKYNDISKTGPRSLLHRRKTMRQALKRAAADGSILNTRQIPGFKVPTPAISPINDDLRYRQWNEVKYPSSNAVIFFARDGSASMDSEKCEIVSDMCYWIDLWIRSFYQRTERCYFWHDTIAEEVDENKFYRYRYGGGTKCSSVLDLMAAQFENRFKPEMYNLYVFYFTDGENYDSDNERFCKVIQEKFNVVNMFGLTQVLAWEEGGYYQNLRQYVDENLTDKVKNVRTTSILRFPEGVNGASSGGYFGGGPQLSDESRGEQTKKAIAELLGKQQKKAKRVASSAQ